jgi:GNAT superfamily N-acetyltransferase
VINEWFRGHLRVSTDPKRLDLDAIHAFLSQRSYWAEGTSREEVERSIRNSIAFGVYDEDRQLGFARVVSDRATFAYLADVFVLEAYRGQGLAKWLVECVLAHPDLQGLRRWVLATRDAHGLYARYGFRPPADPGSLMEIRRIDGHPRGAGSPPAFPLRLVGNLEDNA